MIELKEKALLRIKEAYEGEVYTLKEFKARKTTVTYEIEDLKEAIHMLELKLKHTKNRTNEDRIENLLKFRQLMYDNKISYKTHIKRERLSIRL